MKLISPFTLAFVLMAYPPLRSQNQEPPSCSSYTRCNDQGTSALKSGRLDVAIELFKQQAALAELADIERQGQSRDALLHSPYRLAVSAYNNLALAYFKKREYLWARAWAHVALRGDKNNGAAQFNLRKIEQALANWQWPQVTSGEYVQYAGRGTWERFIVKPGSIGQIEFCFSGLWWGLGEGPSGIGDLTGIIPIHGYQAEYSTREFGDTECRISMKFSADKLEVNRRVTTSTAALVTT